MKRYIIRQKITFLANRYEIFQISDEGESLVAFAQQKRFALKERITFYSNSDKSEVIFEVKARNIMEMAAKYDVLDADGQAVGTIGKVFKQSLISSTWHIFQPEEENNPRIIVEESNIAVAIIRRIWDFLPIINNVPFFVKFHFDFKREAGGEAVATYRKTTLLRDHYELSIRDDSLLQEHDWRTLVAVGVMLDAMQSR